MADEQQDQTDQRDADQPDQHDESHDTTTDTDDLGDKGRQAIQREREARKAAEKARSDLEKRLKAIEDERKQAEDAKAKEQGEWEKIAATREAELKALQDQLAERDRQTLRATIARKHRLPDDALEFVTGDDEDAIEASVKKLAKIAARTEDVDTDSGKRSSTTKQTTKPGSLLASYTFGKRA